MEPLVAKKVILEMPVRDARMRQWLPDQLDWLQVSIFSGLRSMEGILLPVPLEPPHPGSHWQPDDDEEGEGEEEGE